MDINSFNTYSTLSLNNQKREEELQKVLEQAAKFKKIESVEEAKEYVKETWGIEEGVENYLLCEKCYLNINETDKIYCINLAYTNKDITYYYEK